MEIKKSHKRTEEFQELACANHSRESKVFFGSIFSFQIWMLLFLDVAIDTPQIPTMVHHTQERCRPHGLWKEKKIRVREDGTLKQKSRSSAVSIAELFAFKNRGIYRYLYRPVRWCKAKKQIKIKITLAGSILHFFPRWILAYLQSLVCFLL